MTEDELRQLFAKFGEIESLKMHPPGDDVKKLYAFVCFKKPDEASSAKEQLTINDKTLTINHYEIQQIRQQHTHSAKWTDLANQEELQFYLKMLLESMPFLMKQQQGRPMGGPGGHRQQYGNKPGAGMRPNNQNPRGYGQNPRGPGGHMNNMNASGAMQVNPAAAAGMNPAMNPGMASNPAAHMQQVQSQQMTMEQRYLLACHQIINAVTPENPNYKDQVGTVLYEYITALVGPKAPKVTGMIIDLPVEDIRRVMQDWTLLSTRVQQASELLDQQQMQQ